MLFKSTVVSKTWDAWGYYHEGTYYLFYLTSEHYPGDGFGVATSPNGVHWTDHGRVFSPSDKMVRYLGTGSIWKDPHFEHTHRFICTYSEWRAEGKHNVQKILFAWSCDLIHWTKYGDDFIFEIDERFYKRIVENARGPWEDPRWDGINDIPKPGGGYYGYWTATPKDFLGFGFGVSDDGVHWKALEPPRIEWGNTPAMYFVEVGDVHEFAGKYYAMLGDYAATNCGMFGFVSSSPSGPFRPCPRNYSLLRNQSKMHAYFTRFMDSPDGVLVMHHSIAEGQFSDEHFSVYYAPLKQAQVIDGALYLTWWHGNDKLKAKELPLTPSAARIQYEPGIGIVLEGQMHLPAQLTIGCGDGSSVLIRVCEKGITEIGPAGVEGAGFVCEERVDRELAFAPQPSFRLLLHHNMIEFYIDDIFIQCYSMDKMPDGSIRGVNVNDLRLWQWS